MLLCLCSLATTIAILLLMPIASSAIVATLALACLGFVIQQQPDQRHTQNFQNKQFQAAEMVNTGLVWPDGLSYRLATGTKCSTAGCLGCASEHQLTTGSENPCRFWCKAFLCRECVGYRLQYPRNVIMHHRGILSACLGDSEHPSSEELEERVGRVMDGGCSRREATNKQETLRVFAGGLAA